jgi:hypothetical protein
MLELLIGTPRSASGQRREGRSLVPLTETIRPTESTSTLAPPDDEFVGGNAMHGETPCHSAPLITS